MSVSSFDDVDRDLTLRWRGSRTLEVHYQNMEILGFTNFQYIQEHGKAHTVELLLIPPKGKTALPDVYFEAPDSAEPLPRR